MPGWLAFRNNQVYSPDIQLNTLKFGKVEGGGYLCGYSINIEIMKVLRICVYVIVAMTMLVSCDKLNEGDGQLIIDPVEDALLEQTVGSETLTAEGLSFTTTDAWTSRVVPVSTKGSQPMWVSITPDHGDEAGTYTISIILEANDTGEDRTANIIISCGSQTITISITQVATTEVPSQGDVQTPEYKKYVSKLEWNFTDYDGEFEEDVLTFEYDEKNRNRIARITREYKDDGYDSQSQRWSFNYSIAGEVELTYVKTGNYESGSSIIDATLDDLGRVSRFELVDRDYYISHYDYGRYEYDSKGYLSAMTLGEENYGGSVNEEGSKLYYTDGLWSEVQNWGKEGSSYWEDKRKELPYLSTMYAHRHANDKINVDLNPFIMEGDFGIDEVYLFIATRMCGKFTDCLMEIGGEGDDAISVIPVSNYTTPNVTIPVEYTTVISEVPETGNPIVWTFDKDGCPLTATETLNYQEYKVTYNIVVGDTVQWVDQREDANGNPIVTTYYDFTTTPKQYTKTSNSWSCPKVLTVTYR